MVIQIPDQSGNMGFVTPKVTDERRGPPLLLESVPVSSTAFQIITKGVAALWARIIAADAQADSKPLLLSYDVHPTPAGPVLIEVNTNAGGVLAAFESCRQVNKCCAEWEQDQLQDRLIELFQRDLLGSDPQHTGTVAIVDDNLADQPLRGEMQAIAAMMKSKARDIRVIDASELSYRDGRLRHGDIPIDRVYWRSTDFVLAAPEHDAVRRAVAEGTTTIAPSPEAYRAIADKHHFVEWSKNPELALDVASNLSFRIAETVPMNTRTIEGWYGDRKDWVFKPESGYASRGVYVGKSISRQKLAELPFDSYLAQRYTPHPVIDRDGVEWKYDVRFFADRGHIIGAAARVFQGQVVGMRTPGSGFAPIRVDKACCLIGAMAEASRTK